MRVTAFLLIAFGALLLVILLRPFSYLAGLSGLGGLAFGCSDDDPSARGGDRLPALRVGDPALALSARLDRLLGQTGLDPLDPNQPLAGYHVRRTVMRQFLAPSGRCDLAMVEVDLRYAGGSARTYEIPVYQRSASLVTGAGWRATGLDRLLAPHEELSHVPAAGAGAPIQLGAPQRLPLAAEAHRLGTANLGGWLTSLTTTGDALRWAPDGGHFVLRASLTRPRWDAFASLAPDGRHLLLWNGRGGFWTVPLDVQLHRAGYETIPFVASSTSGDTRAG